MPVARAVVVAQGIIALFWMAFSGLRGRVLPGAICEHFGKWSSVYRQFRRWTLSGLWELLLEAFNAAVTATPACK